MIPGYDEWKTALPEESEPVAYCVQCGDPLYEGDATECRTPDKRVLKMQRQAYEEAEREDRENEYII